MKRISSREFFNLLRERNRKNSKKIDGLIREKSLVDKVILVSDSSGFSRKTHKYGILQFLENFIKCHDAFLELVRKNGGEIIAQKADNLMAVFSDAGGALACAVEIRQWLKKRNRKVSDERKFNICSGLHCGEFYQLKDDIYGAAVNVAFKIGEDMAGKDEILLTSHVMKRLGGESSFSPSYSRSVEIGGKNFDLYSL